MGECPHHEPQFKRGGSFFDAEVVGNGLNKIKSCVDSFESYETLKESTNEYREFKNTVQSILESKRTKLLIRFFELPSISEAYLTSGINYKEIKIPPELQPYEGLVLARIHIVLDNYFSQVNQQLANVLGDVDGSRDNLLTTPDYILEQIFSFFKTKGDEVNQQNFTEFLNNLARTEENDLQFLTSAFSMLVFADENYEVINDDNILTFVEVFTVIYLSLFFAKNKYGKIDKPQDLNNLDLWNIILQEKNLSKIISLISEVLIYNINGVWASMMRELGLKNGVYKDFYGGINFANDLDLNRFLGALDSVYPGLRLSWDENGNFDYEFSEKNMSNHKSNVVSAQGGICPALIASEGPEFLKAIFSYLLQRGVIDYILNPYTRSYFEQ
ncbi:MAG: hypothetical protein KatS3mg085_284 [Candidatus Dojkabacteria bacterium]|nr:MAG: hypothetical protein KatS3mg085_284 [Candidatus Dojkabacteria bacterium]GIW58898.1 MAG: hypothetical protein KatS3mg086_183 [Candidatus Dojkabacteria bacterium]